jgi:uncharacterized protein involved in outer membrane biogenesis
MWALLGLLLLLGTAWLGVPPLVKWQLAEQGRTLLGREVGVGSVEFAPWSLRLSIHDLQLAAAAGDADPTAQARIERLLVDVEARSLLRRAPVLRALEIDGLRLRVAHLAPGRYDVDDLLARLHGPQSGPPAAGPPRFAVFNVQVRDAEFRFDDRPAGRVHAVTGLTLALPFLSSLPDQLDVRVQPRLAFALNGSPFDVQGESLPFAADRASTLQLILDDVELAHWWPYVPAAVPLQADGGRLAAELVLQFAQPANAVPSVSLRGRVGLRDVVLRTRDEAPLMTWRSLELGLGDVRPFERSVALRSLRLDGAVFDLQRRADGQLNLPRLGVGGALAVQATEAAIAAAPAVSAARAALAASAAPAAAPPATGTAAAGDWHLTLDEAELAEARLRWRDAATQPAVALDVDGLSLRARQLHWPVEAAAPVEASLRLRSSGRDLGQMAARGEVSDRSARVALELAGIELAAAAPYLRSVLRPALDGRLSASGELDWAAAATVGAPRGAAVAAAPRLAMTLAKVQVQELRLTEPAAPGQRAAQPLRVAAVEIDDARIDLLARQAGVGAVRLREPSIDLRRDAAGQWNVAGWLAMAGDGPAGAQTAGSARALRPGAAPPVRGVAGPAWRVALRDARLERGTVAYSDAIPRVGVDAAPVQFEVRSLNMGLQGLSWPAATGAASVRTRAAGRIVEPGAPGDGGAASRAGVAKPGPDASARSFEWRGDVALQPLGARGTVALARFPVHLFEPYFGAALPVVLRRADLGWQGDVELRLRDDGPAVTAVGDLLLAGVQVHERVPASPRESGAELLNWQALTLRPLRVVLAPGARPRVDIGQAQLSDFFARLEIAEDGRFNLATVAAAPDPAGSAAAAQAAAGATAPAPPGPGLPVDLTVGGTRFANGHVDFSDRFIRPNYRADLTELEGRIGGISSDTPRELASVELRGRAARTALLEIGGVVNPTATPLVLDIVAKVTDLELAPLSPYAGKYAGYAIERGKLNVNLAYKVDPEGRLMASNQIILNQLTFGEKIDSPDATTLPVRLAVALLTDRNGVIDLNLPISGSINEPEFSIWGLVWQVLGNLVAKAVTAPFALLTGGDAADLSWVEFQPGSAQWAASAAATLDKVAAALKNRPALRMTVTGASDPQSEREAMQRGGFEARLRDERRRELLRSGAQVTPRSPPPLGDADRERLVRELYAVSALPDKPRDARGAPLDIPVAAMETLLVAAVPADADAARQLALQRGLAVRDALIERELPSERLFLAAPKLRAAGEGGADWTPRVLLSLEGL